MASTDFTPLLGLPFLLSNQAQKHVTLNESLRALDGLYGLSVISRTETVPPVTPADGDRYLVAAGASDDWTGHDGELAFFADGGWLFFAPNAGWSLFDESDASQWVFDGADWQSTTPTELRDLTLLGVGGTADAGNPFLVKLNALLFTALEAAYGGNGDLYAKFNKETASDTLSMLFQTGYSSRAEFGLIGDDNFTFKVSPDGSTFHEGIVIDKDTGEVSFPNGCSDIREKLSAARNYYVNASTGSNGNDGLTSGTAFATIQHAIDVARGVDANGYVIAINLADGTYNENLVVGPMLDGGTLTIQGNITTPANCVINVNSYYGIVAQSSAQLYLKGVHVTGTATMAITALDHAFMDLRNFKVSCGSTAHLYAAFYSRISIGSNYEIASSATRHIYLTNMSQITCTGKTVTLTGTPNFSSAYCIITQQSGGTLYGNTYAGSATGARYSIINLSNCAVGGAGATYFPGDAAGSVGALSSYA